MKINPRENLDELIKILLLDEIKESKKLPIVPDVDYFCLQIISKHNIIGSGILGLNFQRRESKLFATIKNSIIRICQTNDFIIDNISAKFLISNKNADFGILTKINNFSIFNKILKNICKDKGLSVVEYDDFSHIELFKLKEYGFKMFFIASNFTPYGLKERKVLNERLSNFEINSINFLLNKSQCVDLFSIKLSLKEKLKHKEFMKEYNHDCFYLDQLGYDFILNEVNKIKELC